MENKTLNDIEAQIREIQNSPDFKASERFREFLNQCIADPVIIESRVFLTLAGVLQGCILDFKPGMTLDDIIEPLVVEIKRHGAAKAASSRNFSLRARCRSEYESYKASPKFKSKMEFTKRFKEANKRAPSKDTIYSRWLKGL